MIDLIPNETEILIIEGTREGETIIFTGNTIIKLGDIDHRIFWCEEDQQWLAKPYVDEAGKSKKKGGRTWDICHNCKYWHAEKLRSYCGKTNEFNPCVPTDYCKGFSKKRWGSMRSKESIDKEVRKYFGKSED